MLSNILRTESESDFEELRAAFEKDLNPADSIERQYVDEIVNHTWNIRRYQRIETGIHNNALREGLEKILQQLLLPPLTRVDECLMSSKRLSWEWLVDPESDRKITSQLEEAGFDKSAIEAEACKLVADHLKNANRMAEFARESRDKALRSIAKYRKTLAFQLRQTSDSVLAADRAPLVPTDGEN